MPKPLSTLESTDLALPARRRTSLETQCSRFESQLFKGFLAYVESGSILKLIEQEELYKEHDYKNFPEFIASQYGSLVTSEGKFTLQQARRRIQIAELYNEIRGFVLSNPAVRAWVKNHNPKLSEEEVDEKVLKSFMPTSQSQLQELVSYPLVKGAEIYTAFAMQAKNSGTSITGANIKEFRSNPAIDIITTTTLVAPESVKEDEDSVWGSSDDVKDLAEAPKPLRSVQATSALDRIEAFSAAGQLPPDARALIEQERVLIYNHDLETWNLYNDEDFLKIGLLVFLQDPTVPRMAYNVAYRFLGQMKRALSSPEEMDKFATKASLPDLVYMAILHNGHGRFHYGNYMIDILPAN